MENFSENAIDKIDKNENFLANEPEERLFLTSELDEKYGIRKTAKNDRLKALYIKPIRQGRNFLINAEQLQLMDDLDAPGMIPVQSGQPSTTPTSLALNRLFR